ncbi:hypothetical protein GCM10011371_10120 [Novosphingobium marinum]|uniref:Uncharacterized protein n=1 Tax=Novosphingobium marinum TaxID=1514948 RepID=A0A7Z0BTE7_9SPHN|nr:hypothetical protein [Novosphingobium marinum]NYH95119.1 hypothetical protein [Novosphingobium marinum]GGC24452.1 hypothetical protein GCM10011371_10120 [Novosphingobium marinum]
MDDRPRIGIDLEKLADALPAEYTQLAGKIRRCRDSHSVHTDLMLASDMIGSVEAAFRATQDGVEWAQHAVPALVYSAIILYARAIHTGSGHRARINLTKHLTPAQKARHERIVTLRNDALAHYGPGETTEGFTWNEERLVIPLDRPNDARIMLASRRVGYAPGLPSEMAVHIAQVLLLAQREIERRDAELVDALNAAIDSDDGFFDLAAQHKIDLNAMFGGHPAAALLDGDRTGLRTEIVWGSKV